MLYCRFIYKVIFVYRIKYAVRLHCYIFNLQHKTTKMKMEQKGISKIGFQNIRVFEDLTEFELKPFTILTGANNTGKSGMQKMLLLLSTGLDSIKNEIQLENLNFKKEYINKTGDFKSNVNYKNPNNQICFTFQFEDEILGSLNSELIYEGDESGITAKLCQIAFSDTQNKLITLKRTKNSSGDWEGWNFEVTFLTNYFKKFIDSILLLRNKGNMDSMLHNIDRILHENNDIDSLTPKQKKVYNYYKSRGIVAYDPRAIEIQKEILEARQFDMDYRSDLSNQKIFNEKTGDIYEYDPIATEIWKEFPLNNLNSNCLLQSDLLKVIGGDYNKFIKSADKETSELKKELINKGISSSEDFIKAYREFEIICLMESFKWSKSPDMDESDFRGFSTLNDIFSNKKFYRLNYNDGIIDKKYDTNLILSILRKYFPKKNKPQSFSADLIKSIVLGESTSFDSPFSKEQGNITKDKEIDLFNDSLQSSMNYSLIPFNNFILKLQNTLKKIKIFSTNTKIKRQYLYGDYDIQDSLFLEFGVAYFKNDYKTKEKLKFINYWLNKFDIAKELKISKIKLENETQNQYLGFYYSLLIGSKEVPLYDCGSGIHQIVLLLLNIVSANDKKMLLLEEPETNMHPMFQSKLAELFVAAKKNYRIYFIVETHSEYLIRKLQNLTAKYYNPGNENNQKDEKELPIKISKNASVIYYFNRDKDLSKSVDKIKEIHINEDGGLTDSFGPGFIDESTNLEFDLIKLNEIQNN